MNPLSRVSSSRLIKIIFPVLVVLFCPLVRGLASTPSEIGCGSYRIKGELVRNSSSDYVVKLPGAGVGISEVILLGGDTLAKIENLGTAVAAEIYVPENIRHDSAPFAYLQKWVPFEKKGDPIIKIQASACGERSRFQSR